jgi:hypothetical protein
LKRVVGAGQKGLSGAKGPSGPRACVGCRMEAPGVHCDAGAGGGARGLVPDADSCPCPGSDLAGPGAIAVGPGAGSDEPRPGQASTSMLNPAPARSRKEIRRRGHDSRRLIICPWRVHA